MANRLLKILKTHTDQCCDENFLRNLVHQDKETNKNDNIR